MSKTIFVPKSIKCQSNITDEEIRAFYSLHPVNASNDDYDFKKQLDRIITEYLDFGYCQEFVSANARRCFKKQLKKMILVDKPNNSKKYDHFLSWRLKQISIHKSKQRDYIIDNIKNHDLAEKYNDLSKKYTEQSNDIYKLIKENEELKQKLKKYESGSVIDTQEEKEEVSSDEEEVSSDEESSEEELSSEEDDFESYEEELQHRETITNDCKNIILDIIEDMKSPPVEKPVEPKKTIINETPKLIIKTKNISEEEYKALDTDGDKVEKYWVKIDEVIEEIEKFFIKNCNRDREKITELSNIFYEWHEVECETLLESLWTDTNISDSQIDKICDRPFDILRDNLNQEAK